MKYIIYARKSTDEDDRQVLSIDAQLTELREYAHKEQLEVMGEFVESKTAKVPGRPIFNRMMEKIELGGPYGIISWHPDRLARNSVDGGKIIYLADTGKIAALKFPTFWFEATPQGKFMLNIAFGQSKYYIDNLAENIKRGIRQKLRRGEMPGCAPIGYLNELRHHTIVKDPQRWQLVARLFELYATGKHTLESLQKLSLSWGLVAKRSNQTIALSKMHEILKNPFYYGVFIHKGEMYQGTHEPIISKSLFDRVQRVLLERGKPRKSKERKVFAFTGVFKCGECGRAITAETKVKPSGRKYTYYRCTKKDRVCHQKYVEERRLVEQLNSLFKTTALSEEWRDNFLKQWEYDFKEASTKINSSTANLKAELKSIDEKTKRLLDAYLEQTISHEEYTEVKQKIINQKVEINEELQKVGNRGNNRLELFRQWIFDAYSGNSVALSGNLEEKRSFLRKIGSDFPIVGQKPAILLAEPWNLIVEKTRFSDWSG